MAKHNASTALDNAAAKDMAQDLANADNVTDSAVPQELATVGLTAEEMEAWGITKAELPEGRASRESLYPWDKVPVGYSFFVEGKKVATFYTLCSNRNERGLAQFKAKADKHNGKAGVRVFHVETMSEAEHVEKYGTKSPFAKKLGKAQAEKEAANV